jgi:hypothetical protein
MHKERAAEWPRHEPHGKYAEHGDRARRRIQARKEEWTEGEGREEAVHQEVVSLDGGAEKTRHQHASIGRRDRHALGRAVEVDRVVIVRLWRAAKRDLATSTMDLMPAILPPSNRVHQRPVTPAPAVTTCGSHRT